MPDARDPELALLGVIEQAFKNSLDYETRERVLRYAAQLSSDLLDKQRVVAYGREPFEPTLPSIAVRIEPAQKPRGKFMWRGKWRPL